MYNGNTLLSGSVYWNVMQRVKPSTASEDRLSIRTNSAQKVILKNAAEARRTTVSQFVLEASLSEAERVLEAERTLLVSQAEFELVNRLMDQAPRELPELRALMSEKPVWDD